MHLTYCCDVYLVRSGKFLSITDTNVEDRIQIRILFYKERALSSVVVLINLVVKLLELEITFVKHISAQKFPAKCKKNN
jgi:hypothetical protein